MELQCDLSSIQNEELLRKMWQQSEDVSRKREIRSRIFKLREARLKDLYHQNEIMSTGNFAKDPLTPSHGDSLVDQSFQHLKSKEIRDSISPPHDMKFRSTTLNHPNTTGWDVQTSSEVSPDGSAYRSETVAKTDGVEKINGGTAEFKGLNEQRSSASHQGDDKNFVKKASESSNTNLQEKVVIGDENSGRTEMKMSSTTSSSTSQVTSSSATTGFDGQPIGEPIHNRHIMDNTASHNNQIHRQHQEQLHQQEQLRQQQHHQQQIQQQHQQQQHYSTEEFNRSRQETTNSTNVETQRLHEENKRYIDVDKASPEYQQHVQHLMAQPGEIISNTVEYPKPNVKMITTVKRLPDGTIVKNKRYETEETRQPSETVRHHNTTSTNQSHINTQQKTEKHLQNQENTFSRQQNTTQQHITDRLNSSPRRPQPDVVDNAERYIQTVVTSHPSTQHHVDDNTTQTFSSVQKSNRRYSTETTSETVEEHDDRTSNRDFSTHGFPSVKPNKPTQEYPTDRPQPVRPSTDFSTQGFPSVRPNKPTQEYPTDRPQAVRTTEVQYTTERRPIVDGEVIHTSSEIKKSSNYKTNSERVVETEVVNDGHYRTPNTHQTERIIETTHGFPSVRSPTKPTPTAVAPAGLPSRRDVTNSTTKTTQVTNRPTEDGEVVLVSSETTQKSNYKTNAERVIETEVIREGDFPSTVSHHTEKIVYSSSKPEDFTTHGFPSVKEVSSRPVIEYPDSPLPQAHHGFPAARSPTKGRPDFSTHGFPSSRDVTKSTTRTTHVVHPSSSTTDERVVVTSETTQSSKQKANAERIIETEILTDGNYPSSHHTEKIIYTSSRPEDFSTHGFPSVKEHVPTTRYDSPSRDIPISSPRKTHPTEDFSTHGFPSARSPTKTTPDYSTHGFPSAKSPSKTKTDYSTHGFPSVKGPSATPSNKKPTQPSSPIKKQPTSSTPRKSTTSTTGQSSTKLIQKETDAAHRAFAASLRSSSPVDSISEHQRHTPRSSISSTRTFKRDLREGSHDSTVPSETSRISTGTITRHSPQKNVGKTVVTKQTVVKTRNVNGSNEKLDLTPQRIITKSPSPGKTVTRTTTTTTTTSRKTPSTPSTPQKSEVPKADNQITKPAAKPFPINESPSLTITKSKFTETDASFPRNEVVEVVEKPCIKKYFYQLGPSDKNSNISDDAQSQSPLKNTISNDSKTNKRTTTKTTTTTTRKPSSSTTTHDTDTIATTTTDRPAKITDDVPSHTKSAVAQTEKSHKTTTSRNPIEKHDTAHVEHVTSTNTSSEKTNQKLHEKSPYSPAPSNNIKKIHTHQKNKSPTREYPIPDHYDEPINEPSSSSYVYESNERHYSPKTSPRATSPSQKISHHPRETSVERRTDVRETITDRNIQQKKNIDRKTNEWESNQSFQSSPTLPRPGSPQKPIYHHPKEPSVDRSRTDVRQTVTEKTQRKTIERDTNEWEPNKRSPRPGSPEKQTCRPKESSPEYNGTDIREAITEKTQRKTIDRDTNEWEPNKRSPRPGSPEKPIYHPKEPGVDRRRTDIIETITEKTQRKSTDRDTNEWEPNKRSPRPGSPEKPIHHPKEPSVDRRRTDIIEKQTENTHRTSINRDTNEWEPNKRSPRPGSPEKITCRPKEYSPDYNRTDVRETITERTQRKTIDRDTNEWEPNKRSPRPGSPGKLITHHPKEPTAPYDDDDEPLNRSPDNDRYPYGETETVIRETKITSDDYDYPRCDKPNKRTEPKRPESTTKSSTKITTEKRNTIQSTSPECSPIRASPSPERHPSTIKENELFGQTTKQTTTKTKNINEEFIDVERKKHSPKPKNEIPDGSFISKVDEPAPTSPTFKKKGTTHRETFEERCRHILGMENEGDTQGTYVNRPEQEPETPGQRRTINKDFGVTIEDCDDEEEYLHTSTTKDVERRKYPKTPKTVVTETEEYTTTGVRRQQQPHSPERKPKPSDRPKEVDEIFTTYHNATNRRTENHDDMNTTVINEKIRPFGRYPDDKPEGGKLKPHKKPKHPGQTKEDITESEFIYTQTRRSKSPDEKPKKKTPGSSSESETDAPYYESDVVTEEEKYVSSKRTNRNETEIIKEFIKSSSPSRKSPTRVSPERGPTKKPLVSSVSPTRKSSTINEKVTQSVKTQKTIEKPAQTASRKSTNTSPTRPATREVVIQPNNRTQPKQTPSKVIRKETETIASKDKVRTTPCKQKPTSDDSERRSSPETSPTRYTGERRSSNISVHTEIIIDHAGPKSPKPEEISPKRQVQTQKRTTTRDLIDRTVVDKPTRKLPVTERKESAPVHRVTRKDKDVQMSRSTSENVIKVAGKPITKKPEYSAATPSSTTKPDRRPNKCLTTKTINLTTKDKLTNSEDVESIIIDIQQAKSSREPSPDKIVPTPVPAGFDTGKPRYPDVVQEPEDEPRRKPVIKNIPIYEEESNDYVNCHITEVNIEKMKKSTDYTDYNEEILDSPIVEAPISLDYPSIGKPNDDCLLSVQEKVSKFTHSAEEVKRPKASSPFNRDVERKPKIPIDDECLLTVDQKVNKFIKTAERVTKPSITPIREIERPKFDDIDEDLRQDDCILSVSQKVDKYIKTAEKLAPTTPQRAPELVAKVERQISRQSEPENTDEISEEETFETFKKSTKYKTTRRIIDDVEDEELMPMSKNHTTAIELKRQKDILSRPSVFEPKKSPVGRTPQSPATKKIDVSDKRPQCPTTGRSPKQHTLNVENDKGYTTHHTSIVSTNRSRFDAPKEHPSTRSPITEGPRKTQPLVTKRKPSTEQEKHWETHDIEYQTSDTEIENKTSTSRKVSTKTTEQIGRVSSQPKSPLNRKPEHPASHSPTPNTTNKSTNAKITKTTERTIKHTEPLDSPDCEYIEQIVEKTTREKPSPIVTGRPKVITDSVAARRNIFEKGVTTSTKPHKPASPIEPGRRPSYMDHTRSSLEHTRRDSLEITKSTYSRKSSIDEDVQYERRPNSSVKFDVPQKPHKETILSEEEDIDIEEIFDLEILERLLETVTSYELRRRIRVQIKLVKKNIINETSTISTHKNSSYSSKVRRGQTENVDVETYSRKPKDRAHSPGSPTRVVTITEKEYTTKKPRERSNSPTEKLITSDTHKSTSRYARTELEVDHYASDVSKSPRPAKKYTTTTGDRNRSPSYERSPSAERKTPAKPCERYQSSEYEKMVHERRSKSPVTKGARQSPHLSKRPDSKVVTQPRDRSVSPESKNITHHEEYYTVTKRVKSVHSPERIPSPERKSKVLSRERSQSPEYPTKSHLYPHDKSPVEKRRTQQPRDRSLSPQSKSSSKQEEYYTVSKTSVRSTHSPERKSTKTVTTTDSKTPIWADRKNVLKNQGTTTIKKVVPSSPISRTSTTKTKTTQKKVKDEDSIISSYGIGPTDENGLPLFGIKALKKKKPSHQPCDTNEEVTGYVIEEKYYSDNKSKPVVERKEYIYSTNQDELEEIKNKVHSRKTSKDDGVIRKFEKIDKEFIQNKPKSILPTDTDLMSSSTKSVRRGSVKEMSEKFIRKESSQSVKEKTGTSGYPKAGLILRTNSRLSTTDPEDCYETTEIRRIHTSNKPTTDDTDTGDEYEVEVHRRRSSRVVDESENECESMNIHREMSKKSSKSSSSSKRSFLNSAGETRVVTDVDDVLQRMRNADNVVEDGDTVEDQEARALLNKFIGASVIMKGVENVLPIKQTKTSNSSFSTNSDANNLKKQEVKTTRTTKTIKSGNSSSPVVTYTTCDIEEIWDEEILKQLLQQAETYEERRKIRARLRELMAEREEKISQKSGEKVEPASEESSSESEYEEIIEEVTDYSDTEDVPAEEEEINKKTEIKTEIKDSSSKETAAKIESVACEKKAVTTTVATKITEQEKNKKLSANSDKGESLLPLLQDLLHKNIPQAAKTANQNSNSNNSRSSKTSSTSSSTYNLNSNKTSTNKNCAAVGSNSVTNCSSESSSILTNHTNTHTSNKTSKNKQQQEQQTITNNNKTVKKDLGISNNSGSRCSLTMKQVNRLSVPQKEDSGTESGEDLRLIAAGLRDKLHMQSDKSLIEEVTEALSRLESSLKEGKDIPVDSNKRNSLLALVARLQNGLTSPQKSAEEAMAASAEYDECNDANHCNETSSPEIDDHRSNRQRFAKRRSRNCRHTVGVSREELADARRYMEDMMLMENISNCTTPDANINPANMFAVERSPSSSGTQPSLLQRPNQFVPENIKNSTECLNSNSMYMGQTTVELRQKNGNGKTKRPLSGTYTVGFEDHNVDNNYYGSHMHPSETERRLNENMSPEDSANKSNRFNNKKQLMKRANTIDIPKSKQYNPDFDTDSDGEDSRGPQFGLKRTVQVNAKHRHKNVIPPFEPKTENDHKFLAFINKQSEKPGLGWTGTRSVSNWTNKFGNIKHSFEVGIAATAATTGKPPQRPGHSARNYWNKPGGGGGSEGYHQDYNNYASNPNINYQKQISQKEAAAFERQRRLEREHFEREHIERDRQERQRQERERLERDRLEREYYERELLERERLAAVQHAAMPSMSASKPAPVNKFQHAPQSVFRPIDTNDAHTLSVFKPIPQTPQHKLNTWQPPNVMNKSSAHSPHSSTASSPLGLPWVSRTPVDNTDFKTKASKFEERSQHDNRNGAIYLQRHNSLRSPRVNLQQVDDFRKRPSLPNTTDPYQYAPHGVYAENRPPPPPTNISFTYSDYPPRTTVAYRSQPCLVSAVDRTEDSLTNPQARPLVLTSSNPSYEPEPTYSNIAPPHHLDYPSPAQSSPASPSIATMPPSHLDYTDDDLDSDNIMEYRVESKVMSKPQSQTAVTVGRRTAYVSDDEVYGKNSRSAKKLLHTMKSIGGIGSQQKSSVKKPEPATSPNICLSPDGRPYQAPIVEPIFPELTKFEPDRNPVYVGKNVKGTPPSSQQYYQQMSYEEPAQKSIAQTPTRSQYEQSYRHPPTSYSDTQLNEHSNVASYTQQQQAHIKPYVSAQNISANMNSSSRRQPPPQPSVQSQQYQHQVKQTTAAPYVRENQSSYTVTYPIDDGLGGGVQENLYPKQHPNSLPLRRSRNISENSTESSTVSYNNLPSPNISWTSNPVHLEDSSTTTTPTVPLRQSSYSSNRSEDVAHTTINNKYKTKQNQHQQKQTNVETTNYTKSYSTAPKPDVISKPKQQSANTERPKLSTRSQTISSTNESQYKIQEQTQNRVLSQQSLSSNQQQKRQQEQQQQHEIIETRRKSLGNVLDAQQKRQQVYIETTQKQQQQQQQTIKQVYKSSAPADTPDIVKSSLPKDDSMPILKKFGPPQRHHYVPNAYQSPKSGTHGGSGGVSTTNTTKTIIKTTQQREVIQHSGNLSAKPPMIETPDSPQPEDLIPRNIVFNNISAFTSMSRRQDDDRPVDHQTRTNRLSKCDSWNQIVQLQNQPQQVLSSSPKFNTGGSELRRTKSGHSLAIPKMYEAGIAKSEVGEKQKTVAAYFSGTKSPSNGNLRAEEQYVATKKSTTINRTRTSEKASASNRKSMASIASLAATSTNGMGGTGGLTRSATMPHIANVHLLDESNVDDAFEQLMMDQLQRQKQTTTTEKTETEEKDGAVVTTTTKVIRTVTGGTAPKTVSPFAKFKQLDKQSSQQSSKSASTATATPAGVTTGSPTTSGSSGALFKFTDPALNARAATVKDQLLQWCQNKTREYENIQITNFSTSWSDGLAFCALIHHFLPDAFDYSTLTPQSRRQNFELAFTVADEKAGIAPLLDVEDMVVMKRPDWKCVFVYVQSIYRRFRNCQ